MTDKTDNRFYREAGEVNPHACREGFEQQCKAGINVDWFTWQIAWHDAMFTQVDCAPKPKPSIDIAALTELVKLAVGSLSLHGADEMGKRIAREYRAILESAK